MQIIYRPDATLQFTIDSPDFQGAIAQIGKIQEIFVGHSCGYCGGRDLKYRVRTTKDQQKYYELVCQNPKCGAFLWIHEHKKDQGSGVYTTAYTEGDDGKRDYSKRGWDKWAPKTQGQGEGQWNGAGTQDEVPFDEEGDELADAEGALPAERPLKTAADVWARAQALGVDIELLKAYLVVKWNTDSLQAAGKNALLLSQICAAFGGIRSKAELERIVAGGVPV